MELTQPFIRLPYEFDAARLQLELEALGNSHWMPHPSGMVGNSSLPLVSKNGNANDDFVGHMQTTSFLRQSEYMLQAIASLGEVVGRSRLMRLGAGNEVARHVDFNYHWYTRVRIHIPIVTFPEVIFFCGDEQVHMKAGECWIFDSWRHHRVVNSADADRTHLVIDAAGSSRFWAMVRQAQAASETDFQPKNVIHQPGKSTQLLTEKYNSAPIMAPGEMDALVTTLIQDFSQSDTNDKALVHRYALMLSDLCKDWRELWHQFGYERTGWPLYQQLLERVARQLHPDPRALITQSNNIGVNPVIMQRILRAAMNTDQHADFIRQ